MMRPANLGDTVSIECHVSCEATQGSTEKLDLSFKFGESRMIPGLESAVIGMSPGESKVQRVPPSQAFGEHRRDLILSVPLQKAQGQPPSLGQEIELRFEDGQSRRATVKEIGPDEVVVDANHPLAGEEVVLDLKLISIAD